MVLIASPPSALGEPARQPGGGAAYRSLKIGVAQRPAGRTVYQGRLAAELLRMGKREAREINIWDIGRNRAAG